MKKYFYLAAIAAVFLVGISSCTKTKGCTDPTATNYNASAEQDDGTCAYAGNVVFYYATSGTNATVVINGQTGTVTTAFSSTPSCGTSGCANFTLPIGTYNYTASSTFTNWSGSVIVTKNGCTAQVLQ
jgi:hypothetical protein